jgi:YYY domain-containing protein
MGIYILIVVFALTLGFIKFGFKLDPRRIAWDLGWRMIALIALGVAFFWPYIANYGTAYTSVDIWKDARTVVSDYLVVHGIFLFLAATYLIIVLFNRRVRTMSEPADATLAQSLLDGWTIYLVPALVVLEAGLLFLGLQVFAVAIPLVAVAAWILLERETSPVHRFIALLLLAALLLTLMVEVVALKGDIGRMNTVFKFYLQAWVFFGVANATGLAIVFHQLWFRESVKDAATEQIVRGDSSAISTLKAAWWGIAAILIFAGLLYPAFAGWAKVNDRYNMGDPSGLNGQAYMKEAVWNENNHDVPLNQDYEAIQWLRENINGSPVIAEAFSGLYHWGDRIAVNTGLPDLIGWDWHTKQQYSVLPGEIIDNREADLKNLYETQDPQQALDILHRYGVSFIYVADLERAVYDNAGLGKFDEMVAKGSLQKIYDQDGVTIYAIPIAVEEFVKS